MSRTKNTTCDVCGEGFYKRPNDKKNTDNDYCSRGCLSTGRKGRYDGENNPNYRGGKSSVEYKCEVCGEKIIDQEANPRRFCSRECMGKAYQGGPHSRVDKNNVRYYGSNWQKQRQKRVVKDKGRCVACGMSDKDHNKQIGTGLHVHHKVPVKDFEENGNVDWKKANAIDNLITLCWKCHQDWEKIPVIPQ